MKRALTIAVVLLAIASYAVAAEFWGSRNSNKYHYPTCQWAQRIKPENLVKFSSPEEAAKAGYIPCKVCRPPLRGK
jgi:methylphosphotriester-DNA--protein-cysteine methyltransferase